MKNTDIYQNKYQETKQQLYQDYIKPFRKHKNFRKQFTQSIQQKQKKLYQKDQKIPQPINIYPTDSIKCQICNKYYSYQDAIQHTHQLIYKQLQPQKNIVCQQCPWLCCQQEKQLDNRTFKGLDNLKFQVPKPGLNKLNITSNEDYSTKINQLNKQEPYYMEPLFQKLKIESISYVSQIKKPVYFTRELEMVEQQDQMNTHIIKQVNGLIGPNKNKIKYNFDNQYQQKRKVQSSYPQNNQNSDVICGCLSGEVIEETEQNLKQKRQKKLILKKNKESRENYNLFNQQNIIENMNNNIIKQQQIFSQEEQFIQQSRKSYGQGCCYIQCQVNLCSQTKKNKILSPRLLNSQYQRHSFFETALPKKKRDQFYIEQRSYNPNYGHCPLCGGQKVCSYCNTPISKQFRQKIQEKHQVCYSNRLKDMDLQQQYRHIWSEHRPWQNQFNEEAFNLCLNDARQNKKIRTLKQWQKYVKCQYIIK